MTLTQLLAGLAVVAERSGHCLDDYEVLVPGGPDGEHQALEGGWLGADHENKQLYLRVSPEQGDEPQLILLGGAGSVQ